MADDDIKQIFHKPIDERAILSYALRNVDYFYMISSKLNERDFLSTDNQLIFMTMKTLLSMEGIEELDVHLIAGETQRDGTFQQIGGYNYLNAVNNMVLPDRNFEGYLQSVVEASSKYKLHSVLDDGMSEVCENAKKGKDSSELIGSIDNRLLDLSMTHKSIREPIDVLDGLAESVEERRYKKIELMGISTGFSILDNQIDGMIPGTLFIVAARKKIGKSAFLTNIGCNCAFTGKEQIPVLYVDTELTYEEWKWRVLANMSGVKERIIKHGGYTEEQYNKIKGCLDKLESGMLYHHYMPGFTVDGLIALYKKYKSRKNMGLMLLDYLKEPALGSINGDRKGYEILGDVTTRLKDIAGELNIPALTAVQMNRQNDVADSDRIARYGDIVAELKEKSKEETDMYGIDGGNYKLVIRDTRRGGRTPEEGIAYKFYKERIAFREISNEFQLVDYKKDGVVNYGDTEYGENTFIG